jgi:type IX secretion system substrate protein
MGAYSLTDVGVFVMDNSTELPTKFSLSQNYPNPFNPTTTIKYSIPSFTHPLIPSREGKERSDRGVLVKLIIYNILGREVAVLVNKKQNPGNYEVLWDATEFSSGVYFYQLLTNDFQQTKKLLLIK